jgi:hypothetical protein
MTMMRSMTSKGPPVGPTPGILGSLGLWLKWLGPVEWLVWAQFIGSS